MTNIILPRSVLNTEASPKMSEKYGFLNSYDVANFLEQKNWSLVSASSRKMRDESKLKYASHWLKFRQPVQESFMRDRQVGDMIPEIYFRNSHDGTTGVRFQAGLFRLVCENGIVVEDSTFSRLNVRHAEKNISQLNQVLKTFISGFSEISNRISNMKEISLTPEEQIVYAKLSSRILWGQHVPANIVEKILEPRRQEDTENDLWSIYNRVQENLSKGGLKGLSSTNSTNKNGKERKIKTRGIKDPFRYVDFNSKLWKLTQSKLQGEFEQV